MNPNQRKQKPGPAATAAAAPSANVGLIVDTKTDENGKEVVIDVRRADGQETTTTPSVVDAVKQLDTALAGAEGGTEKAITEIIPALQGTDAEIAAKINSVPASGNGEVVQQTSTTTVQQQNLVKAPATVVALKQEMEKVDIDAWIAKAPSMTSKLLLGQLKVYMSEMKPGLPVDSKKAAVHQLQLYRVLNSFISKVTGEEFTQVWSVVLALFYQEADGVFHDIYVARGFDNIELPAASITAFQNLLHLCKVTADYKVRNLALKQLNLEKALQTGFTEQARQSLLSYYNV